MLLTVFRNHMYSKHGEVMYASHICIHYLYNLVTFIVNQSQHTLFCNRVQARQELTILWLLLINCLILWVLQITGMNLYHRVRLTGQKWKRWFLLLACAFLVKHMKPEMLAKENFFGNPTALQLKLGAFFTISENTEIVARLTIKGQQRWRAALATHAIYNSPSRWDLVVRDKYICPTLTKGFFGVRRFFLPDVYPLIFCAALKRPQTQTNWLIEIKALKEIYFFRVVCRLRLDRRNATIDPHVYGLLFF